MSSSPWSGVRRIAAGVATLLCIVGRLTQSMAAQPNLTPYQPAGWSGKIVVATSASATSDTAELTTTDTLYVSWAVANLGTSSTDVSFTVALTVDGTVQALWLSSAIPQGTYVFVQGSQLDPLALGPHTITLTADYGGSVSESNEADNTASKSITITAGVPATPVIRVDPLALTFSSASATQASASVESQPEAPVAEPAPTSTSADLKVTDPLELAQQFATNTTVRVVVNLKWPDGLTTPAAARSRQNRKKEVAEFRQLQQDVLDGLPGNHVRARFRFDHLASFSAEVTAEGMQALQSHPLVQSIEPVYLLQPHLAQGIPLIHAQTYRSAYNGAGIAIAICDTGLDYFHPRLGGGALPNGKVLGGWDFGDNDNDPIPIGQGHGTSCAGIAAGQFGAVGDYVGGVAPNAALYALKITSGSTGSATSDAMTAAWDWCITHQNDDPTHPILVISTSFGGGRAYAPCDADVPSMTTAASNAVAAGITILASSGNNGYCDSISWPACLSNVMAVGAVYDAAFGPFQPCVDAAACAPTKTATTGCTSGWYCDDVSAPDAVASYSNMSSLVSVLAPGNECSTLDITGSDGYSNGDYYTGFGGTSAACPYVAGAVACLQSAAKTRTGSFLSVAEVRSRLENTGDLIADPKAGISKPRVNLEEAINTLVNTGQPFRIYNDGTGILTVSSITNLTAPWIVPSPGGPFDVAPSGYQEVTVSVDVDKAPAGESTNRLTIVSNDSGHSPYPGGVDIVVTKNTPPTIDPIAAQSTSAGTATAAIPVTVNDAESAAGTLQVSGISSDQSLVADADVVLGGSGSNRTVTVTPAANRSGTCTITLTVSDGTSSVMTSFGLTVNATVAGRFVFYNNSAFDNNDPAANANDDAAVATDKSALLPGGHASFANYISYDRGINGLMIDIAGLAGTPTSSDFTFKVGNDSLPANWATGPNPTNITVRAGAGFNDAARVTLLWPDLAISNQWLQITVLPSARTALALADVFYFGNAIAESGNSSTDTNVDASDQSGVRTHRRTFLNPAPIDFAYDFNRDKHVDGSDQALARTHRANFLNALKLISPPPN